MTTDELRAKFENWWLRNGDPFDLHKVAAWQTWQAAHASRDAEVEALMKDAERWRNLVAANTKFVAKRMRYYRIKINGKWFDVEFIKLSDAMRAYRTLDNAENHLELWSEPFSGTKPSKLLRRSKELLGGNT